MTLTASVAVVTGSSSGIGRAIALALASPGNSIVVHAGHNHSAAEATAQLVRERGAEALVVVADLAAPESHASLAEEAWNWRGRVDSWINNAGVDVLTGPAAKWSFAEKLEALWRVDVVATMLLSREVGRRMREAGGGTIINVGWDQAAQGMAGDSGELFAAIKGAVMAFSRSLAASLAPQVRVNCVAPGWIKTQWGDGASAAWQQRAVGESLLGRWGTPEDIAATVRFLTSPEASFVNGQIIPVNGGFRHA
jgi:3-oxoacyl-[acyl-carrier protein] reductase